MASGRNRGVPARALCLLLYVPSLLYGLIQHLRVFLYRTGVLTTKRLPRPVISVGNIAVGGTGKTPVTATIAGLLLEKGLRVAVLSRGYGGTCEGQVKVVGDGRTMFLTAQECGDEPYLLASTIPGLMVVIGSDRYAAGMLAMERLQPDVFLLDDGFQHLRLQRDLNILLQDYARPLGNGCCLPAGLLRELPQAAQRADLVIQTRCPEGAVPKTGVPGRPNCCARHVLKDLVPLGGGMPLSFNDLRGKNILACAGIAEPEVFFEELRRLGLNLVETLSFPDHAAYADAAVDQIAAAFRSSAAELLLTTEKDGVKLMSLPPVVRDNTLLCRLTLEFDNPAPLAAALRNLLQK